MIRNNRRHSIWIALISILAFHIHPVSAGEVDIAIPSILSPGDFKDFSEEIGLAISYLPMSPAEPLGILGWDIGIELSAVDIDKNIWDSFTTTTTTPPGIVIFPRIHFQKGLPFGIDVGAVYSKVPSSNIKVIGGELKWAIVSGNAAIPAIALRGSYTTLSGVDNFDLETIGADISVSKGFVFVTPYAGYAQVWISSEASTLQLKENVNLPKPYVGVKISLAIINFVFEADFGELPIYTVRLNVGF